MQNPTNVDMKKAKRILWYVKATLNHCLCLKKPPASTPLCFHAFADADWVRGPTNRRSITGTYILLNGNPISWVTKKQTTVSRSNTESEYRAIAHTVTELR